MTAIPLPATAQGPDHPPPNSTDHGVDNRTFPTLWSGDTDGNVSLSNDTAPYTQLAAGTDVPFDRPPAAVATWNRGDHAEFPATNQSTSIHPPDATLTDQGIVRDAYVELFAVQPSTTARLSPDDQPHYVAPNGTVRATVDYRVATPPGVDPETIATEITETRLLVDGTVETTSDGSHTPALGYDTLDTYPNQIHTLTIEADIAVEPAEGTNVSAQTVTVRDSITVTEYDLSVSGFRAEYPNGDVGLVLYKSEPWLGYRFPGGDVRGVWRFYTARDTDWDTLEYETKDGTTTRNSTLVPLQTYAYPIETGPTPTPRGAVAIRDTFGGNRTPPTLPDRVTLDVLIQPYTASYGLATRIDGDTTTSPLPLADVTALGLVRGVTATPTEDFIVDTPIDRATLTLEVRNRTADTVTVTAQLSATQTGEPIATSSRGGYLVVGGQRVNTSADGRVTTTLPRQDSTVSARYVPGRWWREARGYTAASDAVYVGGTILDVVRLLYQIAVPVSLFLGAVFIIDRFTGWHVWPPWRGL